MKTSKTPKARTFKSKAQKKEWLAALLERLAADVRAGRYGKDGCDSNDEGYCLSDVVSDAESGFEPKGATEMKL